MEFNNIGERIRFLRKDTLNLTLKEMSDRLHVSLSNLGNVETGKINATSRLISDISREFGVDQTWLETGEGEMFRAPSVDEELAAFVADVISDDNEFKKRVFYAMSRMDDAAWDAFERFWNDMQRAGKKEKDGH